MDEFLQALSAHASCELHEHERDMLKAVFAQMKENSPKKITMKGFGRAMQWYGPMNDGPTCVLHKNILCLTKKPWFHGLVGTNALKGADITMKFLIRLSSSVAGAFTLSIVGEIPEKITNYRVEKTNNQFWLVLNKVKYTGETLEQLVANVRRDNQRFTACAGSPFSQGMGEYVYVENQN